MYKQVFLFYRFKFAYLISSMDIYFDLYKISHIPGIKILS